MSERCKTCCEYLYEYNRDTHRCHPAWRVWSAGSVGDDPEEADVIYAFDAEDAVREWAEGQDENYTMIDSPETVKVMPESDFPRCREWKTFVVSGEATIDFRASEQKGTGG